MMLRIVLLIVGVQVAVSLGCTTRPRADVSAVVPAAQSSSAGIATAPAASSQRIDVAALPSVEDVAEQMANFFHKDGVLHVTVHNQHRGVEYVCKGWMTCERSLNVVRRDDRVVFASSKHGTRVTEWVPAAKFANGTAARRVVLEYDTDAADGGWPKLLDADLACGPGLVASGYFLHCHSPNLSQIVLGNLLASEVTPATFRDRDCILFRLEDRIGQDRLVWEMYVDAASFAPLRQTRLITDTDGTRKQDDVYDYQFEWLASEQIVSWDIDVDRLSE